MKKILYCMHVGWNWIKQRPHYLAEELSDYYYVYVISDYNYRGGTKNSYKYKNKLLEIHNFYKIPLIDHYKITSEINTVLRKTYYKSAIKKFIPDYIYVMTPLAIKYLPKNCNCRIIYDCMDDMIAFNDNEKMNNEIMNCERDLVNRAEYVFASSANLKNILIARYGSKNKDKINIVRNGFSGEILNLNLNSKPDKEPSSFKFCYFGTIASWINFEFILRSLDDIKNIEYYFIGPFQSNVKAPNHKRIHYIAPVQHDELYNATKDMDAFIMPFITNKLIESVDPVKLYEYINFNKNILCIRYKEVERFDNFVYFYNTYEQYKNNILTMISNPNVKYSNTERITFLKDNNWKSRAETIRKFIDVNQTSMQ